jgi:hypothetical protein
MAEGFSSSRLQLLKESMLLAARAINKYFCFIMIVVA